MSILFDGIPQRVVVQQTPITAEANAEWWKAKYERLEEQFGIVKKRNEDLEERMLNLVEKVEGDKIILSEEIDLLASQLTNANNKVVNLERECARYKKDCLLAVHLLHCQPSHYVQSKDAPEGILKEEPKPQEKNASLMRGGSMVTFPPMAVYLPTEAEETEPQPEDPTPVMKVLSSRSGTDTAVLKSSASFTSEFLQKIDTDEDYSCVELLRCAKCDRFVTAMSRSTQTPMPQPPRPKIVDEPPKMLSFTLDEEKSGEQII